MKEIRGEEVLTEKGVIRIKNLEPEDLEKFCLAKFREYEWKIPETYFEWNGEETQ